MSRKTSARAVGALFLTATVAGVLGAILLGSLDSLSSARSISDNADRITAGALMVLLMCGAIALIPPALFAVLKERGETLALGYVVARLLEVVLLLPSAVGPLMLVAVDASQTEVVRALSKTQDVWAYAGSSMFFCLGALLLNFRLYRSRLVPRWIAGWALVAVVPYLVDAGLVMFRGLTVSSTIHPLLVIPLALNEMVLAVWLLTRGFRAP
jgi:hypothetical protein